MPNIDLELIDSIPIAPMHDGEQISDVLRDFTVEVYRIDDHLVQLHICLDGLALAILPEVCRHQVLICAESVFMGLHIGEAARRHGKDIKKFVRS